MARCSSAGSVGTRSSLPAPWARMLGKRPAAIDVEAGYLHLQLQEVAVPAVTVPDVTVLPRVPEPGEAAVERTRAVGHHRPDRLRRRGVPGAPRVRGRRPARPRPVPDDGPDGRGRVRARRAEGHRLASAPRLRDRHLHHGRHLRAPGQPRRRRGDHQRRHPVDDRGQRPAAHRAAAGEPGRVGRAVPRPAAVGEPAEGRQVARAQVPGPARWRRGAADQPRRRRADPAHRGRARRPHRPGHRRSPR